MKIFVNTNIIFLFLVIIITIDASRIFYLPLPKIHSSHDELKPSIILQDSTKKPYEQKSISDEYIPLSAMERNMYEEVEESEKRDAFDWEAFVDKQAAASRRLVTVNEYSHDTKKELDDLKLLDREIQIPTRTEKINAIKPIIDEISQHNGINVIKGPWIVDTATGQTARLQSSDSLADLERKKRRNDTLFLVIVGTCSLVGVVGLVAAAIFWYKIQKRAEAALDAEYPSYGVTGPTSSSTKISPSSTISDRKLAQSAQMFHYQQQRQQMMAQEKAHLDAKPVHSDDSDDEAPAGGDYTVYECPGLAPTGEMEVRNPLFAEPDPSLTSSTLASNSTTNNQYPQPSASSSSSPPKENSLS